MPDDFLDEELLRLFFDEAKERTQAIERSLLRLESITDPSTQQEVLSDLLRVAHSLKGASGFVEMRGVEKACHKMEDVFTSLKAGKTELNRELLDNLLKVNDAIYETVKTYSKDGLSEQTIIELLDKLTLSQNNITNEYPSTSVSKAVAPEPSFDKFQSRDGNDFIRIQVEKLDTLLYRSEELLTTKVRCQERKTQASSLFDLAVGLDRNSSQSSIDEIVSGLRKITDALDEDLRFLDTATIFLESEIRRVRTLPFDNACNGLSRVVRDACNRLGKTAHLIIEGGDVEIDHSVTQGVNDILRHLVRNAIDHGISSPQIRKSLGLNPVGKITVKANTTGDRLRIQVIDDGRGILRKKPKSTKPIDQADDRQYLQEIFSPGYSTAECVTELSGRGIGLDIVKRTVERLRGFIDVTSNESGGTTFKIILPTSLTVTRGLIISSRGQSFAIETATARQLITCNSYDVENIQDQMVLNYDGRVIPIIHLDRWLHGTDINWNIDDNVKAIILGDQESETAVIINEIVGEQELLVRPLGPRVMNIRKYSGAAALPNGDLVLILNPLALIEGAVGLETKLNFSSPVALVVDDSPTIRQAQKLSLEESGFKVVLAYNGIEALDYLSNTIPSIVLADVDMPGMDGIAMAKSMKSDARLKDIPIILITSRNSEYDKQIAAQAQVDGYIVKNSKEHVDLIKIVKSLLNM